MHKSALRKLSLCVFSVSIQAAFGASPVYNGYSQESQEFAKRYHVKIYTADSQKKDIALKDKYNTIYYGSLEMGSDNQRLTATFDTGSSNIWVPGEKCDSSGCYGKHRFSTKTSTTFSTQGVRMVIKYGAGSMTGTVGYDDITIGGMRVKSQGFGLADNISRDFYGAPFDGVLGLAYKALSRDNITPWIDNAVQQGVIDRAEFSFYLSNTPDKGDSVMVIGAPDPAYYQGSITWHALTPITEHEPSELYYNISFDGISVGDTTIPLSCHHSGDCKTVVDSGTSLIIGPESDVKVILEYLNVKPDCSNLDELPDLVVSIDSHHYKVPARFYVVKMPNESGTTQCQAGIAGENGGFWTLGDSFMRAFYTVFDKSNDRVGFAQLADGFQKPVELRRLN